MPPKQSFLRADVVTIQEKLQSRITPKVEQASQLIKRRFTRERFENISPGDTSDLIKGILPRVGVAMLVGPTTSGKTFLALDWALKIARGDEVSGRRTDRGGVAYIFAEDAAGGRLRVAAWRRRNPSAMPTHFQLIPEAPDLRDPDDVRALVSEIAAACAEFSVVGAPLAMIVLDTLSKSAPGADLNSSADMSKYMTAAAELSARFQCLVLILAHPNKDDARSVAGWNGQRGAADAILHLIREDGRGSRRLTVGKLKNGRDGTTLAFRLDVVELGRDKYGDPVNSCVVDYVAENAPSAFPQNEKEIALPDSDVIVLGAIKDLTERGKGLNDHHLQAGPFGVAAVDAKAVKQQALSMGLSQGAAPNGQLKTFNRSLDRLAHKQLIGLEGNLVWLIN